MSARPRLRFRSQSIDIPLRALGLIDANEGGLAAHGQPDILRLQVCVDVMCKLFNLHPILLGEGPGRPWWVVKAANGYGVAEVHLCRLDRSPDGRGLGGVRGADERYVALARE